MNDPVKQAMLDDFDEYYNSVQDDDSTDLVVILFTTLKKLGISSEIAFAFSEVVEDSMIIDRIRKKKESEGVE